jgi:hypothetical protein
MVVSVKTGTVVERFTRALDALVADIRQDRAILAAILCGSLSHDTVWERSDIDLALVTIDDQKVPSGSISLYADGLNVHAWLTPRAQFRRIVEGSLRSSFMHSLLAKGRLLYTHDETVAALCQRLQGIGERDRQLQALRAGINAIGPLDKAHKWFVTRGDLNYSALWLLYSATAFAQIELTAAGQLLDREVIPEAAKLNPPFFKIVYTDLLNTRKSDAMVRAALDAADDYLRSRAPTLFALVLEHLRDVREARSATELEAHFTRTLDVQGVTLACEYLATIGLIGKASVATRLTRRSTVDVQELAFVDLGESEDTY